MRHNEAASSDMSCQAGKGGRPKSHSRHDNVSRLSPFTVRVADIGYQKSTMMALRGYARVCCMFAARSRPSCR